MQKQSLPGVVPVSWHLGSLIAVAARGRLELDIVIDSSLFQFWPLGWDSIIYPKEHFTYIQLACWSRSFSWKDIVHFFYTTSKTELPKALHCVTQALCWWWPDLSRNCWAVSALLRVMVGGKDTLLKVFLRAFHCWSYSQQAPSHSCREPHGS